MRRPSPATAVAILLGLGAASIGPGTADAFGTIHVAPPTDIGVIGTLGETRAAPGESLVDVAMRWRIGQDALRRANPGLPRWLPLSGAEVLLPTRHVLPAAPRAGIVVNLPERRLYDYTGARRSPHERARIAVHPVSIGRVDWATPLGLARIVARRENPDWTPPASIRAEAAARGRTLPAVVAAGPDNPLGRHALYLDLPGYLLHGTVDRDAIGLRVTHGCVRLYPADIAALYRRVPDGTAVRFVDEPVKVGWHADRLYLEAHPPLEERHRSDVALLDEALGLLRRATRDRPVIRLDSSAIGRAMRARDGLPVVVGRAADGDLR